MNKHIVNIDKFSFLQYEDMSVCACFSTSKGNLNFNKNTNEGIGNLIKIKNWFKLEKIGYLNQIHSDNIYIYDEICHDGDAIITDKKNVGIGIFTADCIPVLIYDKCNKVIAAVHSGWKGTLKCIVSKTIDKMIKEYNTNTENLIVYIGPHNMMCCYEVSTELIGDFKREDIYKNTDINNGRKLNLQECILKQLIDKRVNREKINLLNLCTNCSKEYEFYSYRKQKEKSGRMFSFIFMK